MRIDVELLIYSLSLLLLFERERDFFALKSSTKGDRYVYRTSSAIENRTEEVSLS